MNPITIHMFTKIEHDYNGNPRYYIPVYHFFNDGWKEVTLDKRELTAEQRREIGLSKYRGKKFGKGYTVQSYNLESTVEYINQILNR